MFLLNTDVLLVTSLLGVLWNISCLTFVMTTDDNMVSYAQPATFALFLLVFLSNPTRTLWWRSRRWLLNTSARIVAAPFCKVRFADFWLADQMNSLVVAFRDMEFIICFYAYEYSASDSVECVCSDNKVNFDYVRTVVALLPAWFRFAQCLRRYYDTRKFFPHLVNAGKYLSSIAVTVLSTLATVNELEGDFSQPLHTAWAVCWFVSTLYALTWDLVMDWGLLQRNAGENFLLRDQIVYDSKAYYYLAIFADVVLRLLKPLTVTIGLPDSVNHELQSLLLGLCEILRRFIWNFFRLENEHINNCGEFRAVRDISIKPIEKPSTDDITGEHVVLLDEGRDKLSIEQMMDSETGPLPKRKAVQMLLESNQTTLTKSHSSTRFDISKVHYTKVSDNHLSTAPNLKKKSGRRLASFTVI